MLALYLLTLALALTSIDDPPDAPMLIGRLGSESFDDRVAACKALQGLGGAALPALRAAAGTGDRRVRSRVLALIESIGRQVEAERIAKPTMVKLDFRTRPLGEIVDGLNERSDIALSLRLRQEHPRGLRVFDPNEPERLKALRNREVKPRAARPLPFWEAIDRLCEAAGLRYTIDPRPAFVGGRGSLALLADQTGRGPVSDFGPFRVEITWNQAVIERDIAFDVNLPRPGGKPLGGHPLTVPLAVLPEPGLMLRRNGPVSVTEAVDDRGRSLLVPSAPAVLEPGPANRFPQARYEGDAIRESLILAAADPPVKVIRRLRGKVPVVATARGSDPIVIPLSGKGVLGTPYSTRDLILVVDEVSLASGAAARVKVTVRVNHSDRATFGRHDPPNGAAYNLGGVLEHLEIHDSAGRRLNHYLGSQMRSADGDRYEVVVAPFSPETPGVGPGAAKTAIPSELRYYGFVETVLEIPFDFRDIPVP